MLYKENMDSAHALGFMTRLLHVSQSCLCVAGTKDKRAVTVQHVTAFKVPYHAPDKQLCLIANPYLLHQGCSRV